MKTFILSDNSKNSYGFRLDMSKLQLDRFKSNPVMLYNHGQLIGKWDNIKVEEGKLSAEPTFMEGEDEKLSVQTKKRVEDGFLKGASLGLNIISVLHVEGESPIVEAEVYECSIVDIPSNANAIVLYNEEGQKLEGEALKLALTPITKNKPINKKEMKLNATNIAALGLTAEATDAGVNTAIEGVIAENAKLKAEVDASKKEKVDNLVNLAFAEGRIAATEKDAFIELANTNFELATNTIAKLPSKKSLTGRAKEEAGSGDERDAWTFKQWRKEDTAGLLSIKKSDPDKYAEIVQK